MGTRADFYVGRGVDAKWLGSVCWDGYPSGITPEDGEWAEGQHLFDATTEEEFIARLRHYFVGRRDVTLPKSGWPWPWETSSTTDYAYAFDGGQVWASCFGHEWFDPRHDEAELDESEKTAVFPDMSDIKNVTFGDRSGLSVFTA